MFRVRVDRQAFLKLALLCGCAVQSLAAPAQQPTAESRPLESLPNLTIAYYDVSGANIREINDSILMQQGEEVSTSAASWDMKVSVSKRQVGDKCEIAGANVQFSASVKLPRHLNENQLARQVREAWQSYLAKLKARQATDLWFVYDRLPEVEQAVRASNCDTVGANASAAIEKIKAAEAAYIAAQSAPPAPK
jgi:predicted secreted Zn-dependent protease